MREDDLLGVRENQLLGVGLDGLRRPAIPGRRRACQRRHAPGEVARQPGQDEDAARDADRHEAHQAFPRLLACGDDVDGQ